MHVYVPITNSWKGHSTEIDLHQTVFLSSFDDDDDDDDDDNTIISVHPTLQK